MSLRWYYSVDSMTVLEITDRVDWPQIEIGGKANQDGWVGDLIVDDPAGDFIPLMFRRIYAIQDAAPSGDQNVGNWFISNLKVTRKGNTPVLAARTWTITMADENSLIGRRKFVGSDSNRPAETDIERLRWALTTTEMNTLDPDETYIDTTSPVDLDAADLRTQGPDELMASLMTASGKQYWVMYREDLTPHVYSLWYANQNTSALYVSVGSLSNVVSEVGVPEDTHIWPLSADAELDRAGGRMASGLVEQYKTNWIYLQDTDVGDAYAYVDRVATSKNVSSLTKATAEVTRQLHELALPDDEITTTVTVEEADLNVFRHGMLTYIHATHFPNYTDDSDPDLRGYNFPGYAAGPVGVRIMERTIRQVGPTTFQLPLRLSPVKSVCPEATPAQSFDALNPPNTSNYAPTYGDGNVIYHVSGGGAPTVPSPGYIGAWNFGGPNYDIFGVDYALGAAENSMRIIVVGDGTLVIPTHTGRTGNAYLHARLVHLEGGIEVIDDAQVGYAGDTFTFTVDSGGQLFCTHWAQISGYEPGDPSLPAGYDAGFGGGATWTPV